MNEKRRDYALALPVCCICLHYLPVGVVGKTIAVLHIVYLERLKKVQGMHLLQTAMSPALFIGWATFFVYTSF